MFIILYGLTGTVGSNVREYLERKGLRKLKKMYYSSDEADRKRLEGTADIVTDDLRELEKNCDFKYMVNDRTVGFNRKEFEDAVQGSEDLYTTLSCTDIEFLKSLKGTYRGYVTIVYVYFDDKTLKDIINSKYKGVETPERVKERLSTGKKLKHVYINNIALFDNVVLYGGDGSVFDSEKLYAQLDEIIKNAKSNEIQLNSQRKVQLPYVGPDDYIFISYSHHDKERVEEILRILQRNGFRAWYDSGIKGGEDWKRVLREKIKNCKNFIVFTSKDSVQSEDVKIEIITADIYEKKIIIVRLDDSSFDGTIGNTLHGLHAINAGSRSFEKALITSLDEATREPAESEKQDSKNNSKNNSKKNSKRSSK